MRATVTCLYYFICWMNAVAAFTVRRHRAPMTHLALASVDVPPPMVVFQPTYPQLPTAESPLSQGIMQHMSSTTVALQERKIPTAEEVQQKKNTFNLIFWGGGFVAPFLATIFYFGFRFWEK
ncbi:hypothetical protein FisN_12Hu097 [Fistulifera solaris]|uniref:Uncharacterized protein n=1 Tax=Fistulifera solaris TaxID=1519565 RepID=A0A1Z5KQZ9_FISSO|nr:hypothetical protein FisN_12Hu097 [Fistulifera solaris]|eukprot:GAX28535.1 hypothetical protein FisN_12Hu097 [Fistulifera solaris]